jgi:ATP-dependent DNA helicase RecQ
MMLTFSLEGQRAKPPSPIPAPSYCRLVDPLVQTLRERFGLDDFRPWQREAIEALLEGPRHALVVAPTGGGKSLCYQLPATMLGGTSVVISPLIALMDDQVRALEARGIPATYLASTLDAGERRRREQQLRAGAYRLVYIAPERLRNEGVVHMLRELDPPLVAVDEAHCISHWGHDFRPDYLRLGEVLAALRPPRVLACTATATPLVRDEILEKLRLPSDRTAVVLRGFARPNLHLEVSEVDGMRDRRRLATQRLRAAMAGEGGGIVYGGTRKECERFASELAGDGWRARPYHAGLEAEEREKVSELFASRALDVVVATNAFGMGIDRPDIRCVVHLQAPGSIEQYYQEVGRAGRDGQPAHGLLISGSSDFGLRRRLIEMGTPSDGSGRDAFAERQWSLFLELMRYVEAGSCRHDFILRYFGDEHELLGGCGHCDVCARLEERSDSGPGEDAELLVRKALAGVARLRGRAGLKALASSLGGCDTPRLRELGLTQLTTHGILKDRSEAWILALLRRLMTAALVDVTPGQYPVPFLTAKGRATMKSEVPARVVLPDADVGRARLRGARSKSRAAEQAPDLPMDPELFERLREVRLSIARDAGVPAYVVCHDRSLREMAAYKPTNVDALGSIHGMGPARIDMYGDRFLSAIREP